MLDAKLALAFVLGALSGAVSERWGAPSDQPPEPRPAEQTPSGGDPCDACIAAANSGNFAGAAQSANQCTDAHKKAQCQKIVKSKAPAAAQAAAFNGQCGAAKAIAASAQSMGAGSSSLKKAVSTCR